MYECRFASEGIQPRKEHLDSSHFYAAYVFDDAANRQRDVTVLMEQARLLGYPVRYWWLSETMELEGDPDRLVIGVHYPSAFEDAGFDLHEKLTGILIEHQATWNDQAMLEIEEYRNFGKSIRAATSIFEPDGLSLFPDPEAEPKVFFTFTRDNVQFAAQALLGRDLTEDEEVVERRLPYTLDWFSAVKTAISASQEIGSVGPGKDEEHVT